MPAGDDVPLGNFLDNSDSQHEHSAAFPQDHLAVPTSVWSKPAWLGETEAAVVAEGRGTEACN